MRYTLILMTLFVSIASLAATFSPQQDLFQIADTNPRWEELTLTLDLSPTSGDIKAFRIRSGSDTLFTQPTYGFSPGVTFKKAFIKIENVSFYPDRGGRLEISIGEQTVPADILRSGHQWIAKANGKRIRMIRAEVRRLMGVPVGINEDVPIRVSRLPMRDFGV